MVLFFFYFPFFFFSLTLSLFNILFLHFCLPSTLFFKNKNKKVLCILREIKAIFGRNTYSVWGVCLPFFFQSILFG
ncbi:unnamed protein product [Meloidogyne enterolobii]|uniref:Uncharacterized protein n=1 Tax=Meloidogyne enterolobii TaxID=390850 RepID=A0ACB0XQ66_MELEN